MKRYTLARLFRLGVTEDMDFRLAKRIILSNQFAFLIAALSLLYTGIFGWRAHFNFIPIVVLLCIVAVIWTLNNSGITYFSRLVTSLTPALGLLFMNVSLKFGDPSTVDILHYATPRMLILGSMVMPFTMFTTNELNYMIIGLVTILALSFGYDLIHKIAGVDYVSLGKETKYYGIIYEDMVVLAIMIIVSSVFMFRLGHQYDQKNQKMLDEALKQTEQAKKNEEMMKQTLVQLEEAKKKDEERNWVSKGLNEMITTLQSGEEMEKLFDKLLAQVVRYCGFNQGAFYIAEQGESDRTLLKMVSCYAYERKKYIGSTIDSQEGVLGQAYLEGGRFYLKQVPHDYLKITSGLGEATPRHLAIIPMKINNKVEGMMELASFPAIEERHFELLEKLGESLASYVGNNRINAQTKTLLEHAQTMSQELKENEEEMRQNLEELTATQEALARKEKEYQQRIAELEEELRGVKVG